MEKKMKIIFAIFLCFLLSTFNAHAQRNKTLIIGMDISDGITYDPSRQADISTPFTLGNVYETLVIATPDNYEVLKPALAKKWETLDFGKSWRFYLRDNARFWNGEPVTSHDVKFTFDRLKNMNYQPKEFVDNVKEVIVIDDKTFDIFVINPKENILPILTTVSLGIYSKKQVEAVGGRSDEETHAKDTATKHFDSNSFGSGPYRMTKWTRNEVVIWEKNAHWHKSVFFDHVIIRHIPDGANQLLALQTNEIDIAFNLTNEQIEVAKKRNMNIVSEPSLDYVYMVLTTNAEFNKSLADRNARLAVAHAIDYDGIITHLLGGFGVRPASIIPIGIGGTTKEQTEKFGYKLDLNKAKEYLKASNSPNGFQFTFHYSTSPTLNVRSSLLAQKIKSDLAKINVEIILHPMDASTLTTQYRNARLQSAIASYTIDALDANLWTRPFVTRIAKRMHWQPSKDFVNLADIAAKESDMTRRNALYEQYQRQMINEAVFINLVQPVFKLASNKQLKNVNLTAAGWYMNVDTINRQ
jgi:peptide/nickel transport system substrate-binding protein